MNILNVHCGDLFTVRSGDHEYSLRVLSVGPRDAEIGIERDDSLRVVPQQCDDNPRDVRLAVYPR